MTLSGIADAEQLAALTDLLDDYSRNRVSLATMPLATIGGAHHRPGQQRRHNAGGHQAALAL